MAIAADVPADEIPFNLVPAKLVCRAEQHVRLAALAHWLPPV
jgi:hypothetical protein